MLSLRLMLILIFFMVDMAMDILAMQDTTDILMPTMDLPTTESVRLMLSPRLMLTPIFFMVDMDILAMLDTTDIPMPTMALPTTDTHMLMDMLTTESALLMPSPRPMLTLTFCTEDMDMDTLDTVDTTDTHMVDMPTTDKL